MRFSVLLALASGLLTHALPTGPNTSLNAVNATLQWTPDLPYPAGDSAATCPLGPGPNPFSTLEVPGRKKRSLTTATHLRRCNETFREIWHLNINHFHSPLYYTQDALLLAGTIYVFSWALNTPTYQVTAWRKSHDGTSSTLFQIADSNAGTGTMTLNIDQTGYVYFSIRRYLQSIGSGEIALFQIGPGGNP